MSEEYRSIADELVGEYGVLKPRRCNGLQPGLLVAVEGVDGAGVTTLSRALVEVLSRVIDAPVVYEKEPTRSPIGELIRAILRGAHRELNNPQVLAHLFAADRLYHLYQEGLLYRVLAGTVVVLDRYKYSSAAYQGGGWGKSIYTPREVLDIVNGLAPPANILVYIDVEPRVALERLRASRGVREEPENLETLSRVRRAYLEILSELSVEPEWPTSRAPWVRVFGEKGVEPSCFYGSRAPITLVVDGSAPRREVARNAARALVARLVEEGLLLASR